MTIDELRREALGLDLSSRARLAHELLSSLDDLSEAEIEQLWLEESQRRLEEVASGAVEAVSADDRSTGARGSRPVGGAEKRIKLAHGDAGGLTGGRRARSSPVLR